MELIVAAIALLILLSLGSRRVWSFFEPPGGTRPQPPGSRQRPGPPQPTPHPDTESVGDAFRIRGQAWLSLDAVARDDPRLVTLWPRDEAWMLGEPTWREGAVVEAVETRPWAPEARPRHGPGATRQDAHALRDARPSASGPFDRGLW